MKQGETSPCNSIWNKKPRADISIHIKFTVSENTIFRKYILLVQKEESVQKVFSSNLHVSRETESCHLRLQYQPHAKIPSSITTCINLRSLIMLIKC